MTPDVHTSYRLVGMGQEIPAWAGLLLTLCAATAAVLLLRGELRRRRRRSAPALLYAARTLLAACLGLLVVQPVLFIRREWDQPGVLALIADRSRSMLRADHYSQEERLDLASALNLPAMRERETLPGRIQQQLLALEPAAAGWRQEVFAIQDELGQGLPWGAAFGATVSRLAEDSAEQSAELREHVEALGKLEARLASAPKEEAGPDPGLFAPLYLVAERLSALRDALARAAGNPPLDEPRAAGLLRDHDALLAALRAAGPAMASLQRWCDERFLGGLPQAARKELEGLSAQPRFELAARLARQLARDPALAAKHRIQLVGFDQLTPADALDHTDLFAPIDQLLAASLDEVVSGAVLFSDGRQNLPERPEVLRRLASRDATLLLAGVGVRIAGNPPGEPPNVAIADYRLPGVLLGGGDAAVVVDLKAAVPKGTAIQLELTAGTKPLARQSLTADGSGEARAILSFRAPDTLPSPRSRGDGGGAGPGPHPVPPRERGGGDDGTLLLTAKASGQGASASDEARMAPHVLSRPARVLVVAEWARWDVAYLLAALRGKPCRVDLALWGGSREKGVRRGLPGAGDGRGSGKIPDQLAHLKRYGLIVLDGEPFPGITQTDGQLLASYVREVGGALLVVADGAEWYGQKLAGLLPSGNLPRVPEPAGGYGVPIGPPPSAVMLPAVSLSADSGRSVGAWSGLPSARRLWAVPDQAIPLLVAGGKTVLSVGFYGRGKVYALGCGDLFRLREWDRAEPAERFLASLLDDALQPVFRDEKAKLALYPFAPRAGSTAHVWLDARGVGSTAGAQVTFADGSRAPLAFGPPDATSGLAQATFRVAAAGPIAVEVPGVPPLSAGAASSVSREDIDFTLDEATLRRLARDSGGRYVRLPGLARAAAELPARPDHRVAVRQVRLWNLWWLLPALAALMAADWALRRKNGLVL